MGLEFTLGSAHLLSSAHFLLYFNLSCLETHFVALVTLMSLSCRHFCSNSLRRNDNVITTLCARFAFDFLMMFPFFTHCSLNGESERESWSFQVIA